MYVSLWGKERYVASQSGRSTYNRLFLRFFVSPGTSSLVSSRPGMGRLIKPKVPSPKTETLGFIPFYLFVCTQPIEKDAGRRPCIDAYYRRNPTRIVVLREKFLQRNQPTSRLFTVCCCFSTSCSSRDFPPDQALILIFWGERDREVMQIVASVRQTSVGLCGYKVFPPSLAAVAGAAAKNMFVSLGCYLYICLRQRGEKGC